jgi:hypothetical protein
MERFTNKSPGALTMEQAIARHKKQMEDHRRQVRRARELAAQGRGEDTEIAHVALGELVIPRALQSPELIDALQRSDAAHNIPLEMLSIGNAANQINPSTGQPEFGFGDWFSGLFDKETPAQTPSTLPFPSSPNADDMKPPTFESLDFDPNGPGEWGAALRDPIGAWKANRIQKRVKEEAHDKFNGDIDSLVNGPGDAWRHGRWVQGMAHELGPQRAKAFSDAHEITWKDAPGATLMDIYNNRVALSLPNDPQGHMNPETALQNAWQNGYFRRKPF